MDHSFETRSRTLSTEFTMFSLKEIPSHQLIHPIHQNNFRFTQVSGGSLHSTTPKKWDKTDKLSRRI